jgi:hypothetical protein
MDILDPKEVVMNDVSFDTAIYDVEEGKEVTIHIPDAGPTPQDLLRAKFVAMMQIQDELNCSKNVNWRLSQHNYEDAMMIETAEMFDQMNWKWWKANPNPVDWNQVKLELIDVWHFALCRVMVQQGIDDGSLELVEIFIDHDFFVADHYDDDVNAGLIQEGDAPLIEQAVVLTSVRDLMQGIMQDNVEEAEGLTALRNLSYLYDVAGVMLALGMTVDELYQLYIGKVELNRLRWANGYGTTYIKTWFGKEDNIRLIELMNGLDTNAPDFRMKVRASLEESYKGVKADAFAKSIQEHPGE